VTAKGLVVEQSGLNFPMAERIRFRAERDGDQPFLFRLYASTRAEEMKLAGWDTAQKEAFLRMQFQFQTTHYRRYFADASFQIILLDGEPIGRLYVHYGASEIRLMDVALLSEHRGAGIGGWILRTLLSDAEQSQKRVTLHVEKHNRALRLYQRLNFRVAEDQGVNLRMETTASCVSG
jgi:ribosomal protein S18 acetylase RimI-like enzyme